MRAENEEARKQREKMADEISLKFSCFKRDFMGAPIWRALKNLKAGINALLNNFLIGEGKP